MFFRKLISVTLTLALTALMVCGCGSSGAGAAASGSGAAAAGGEASSQPAQKVMIARQNGLAYIPMMIMEKQGLVNKYYENAEVTFTTLNSGAAINDGLISGDIQFGGSGLGPAITAVMKGIPARIAGGVSRQPHKLMTSQEDIKTLADIGDRKIALVNIGSIQHVILAMGAKAALGDAHALDNNIVAMGHPDGMSALLSGSVECHLTTAPYLNQELENPDLHEVEGISDAWPEDNSFIVLLGSTKLHDENPELFQAVLSALDEAIKYIEENPAETAEMVCEEFNLEADVLQGYIENESCKYGSECKGVFEFATFMAENDFLDGEAPGSFADLTFEGVKGD